LDALPGDEVEFDLPGGRVLSVTIPEGAKPGEMATIGVSNGAGKGANATAAGKVSKKRGHLCGRRRPYQDPQRRQQ
jgi:ABC-type hemin transport system ATPase subunit